MIQPFASLRPGANLSSLPVVDERLCKIAKLSLIQIRLQPLLCRSHQGAVKGSTYLEQNRSPGATGLSQLHGSIHCAGVSGDDDLIGSVEIRGCHDFPLRGLGEHTRESVNPAPETGPDPRADRLRRGA